MSLNRRFIPIVVFGVFCVGSYVLAILKTDDAERLARDCGKAGTCGMAEADFTNAVLIALFGTMLLIAGGFISVLIGQQEARRTPPPMPPMPGVPPYGPPR